MYYIPSHNLEVKRLPLTFSCFVCTLPEKWLKPEKGFWLVSLCHHFSGVKCSFQGSVDAFNIGNDKLPGYNREYNSSQYEDRYESIETSQNLLPLFTGCIFVFQVSFHIPFLATRRAVKLEVRRSMTRRSQLKH